MAKQKQTATPFTLPGLNRDEGRRTVSILQYRLNAYTDLHLTLKHAHWNVVGPNFIGVHLMLDPQVEVVRGYADQVAERIAALGAEPLGTVDALANADGRKPYPLNRADTQDHLKALNMVYARIIEENRQALEELEKLDLVTQDLLIGHTAGLEQFQWFIRAHLETPGGKLPSDADASA